MARYSSFLGRRVEVQYRAGDILLPASGVLVADTGRSIFLEQSFEQRGKNGQFRWEIPYQCMVRIHEKPDSGQSPNALKPASAPEASLARNADSKPPGAALGAAAPAGGGKVVPLDQSSKTARSSS